jgi:hypothetical protein
MLSTRTPLGPAADSNIRGVIGKKPFCWRVVRSEPAPSNYPTNPNACVGASSTSANAQYQAEDPDKYRSDQAHGQRDDLGRPGRADSVSQIPQCLAAGLERGNDGN